MASKIDQAFIDNLQNFTNALEGIVELLKYQADKGDLINKMASAMDGDKISKMTEDIKNILDVSKKVDDRTKEILNEIKAARKQKETGMFEKIQDKDNKKKIVDGVGVIMLIAGGVLAIGMAFKIIGNIDFLSVVALSAGILMISHAFAKIAEIKELTPKKVLYTGLAVIGIAVAVTISSYILQNFKPMSGLQMFSFVIVSTALGAGAYFIMKSLNSLKLDSPKDIAKILLLPLILPAIAGGIVLSSLLLTYMQPVSFMQAISAIFVGAILAVGSIAIMFIMKATKGVNPLQMLMTTALIPLIAGGIVLSSIILQYFEPIKNPIDLLIGSAVIGLSLLAFTPTVWILGKLPIQAMLIGSLGVIVVSAAVMISSWVLSVGNYSKYPDLKWALGAGLSVLLFSLPMFTLGMLMLSGVGAIALALGIGAIGIVSAGIVLASEILRKGKYDVYPGLKWASGAGLSLFAFGTGMVMLGLIPFAGKILSRGNEQVQMVANAIKDVSFILAGGNYTGGPTKEWAEGIGLSLSAFAYAASVSMEGKSLFSSGNLNTDKFREFMVSIASGMIDVAKVLGNYDWNDKHPSKEWAEGVATSLVPFIDAYDSISQRKRAKNESFGILMKDIATSMVEVANILKGGDFTGGPDENWANGISKSLNAFTESISNIDDKKVKVIKKFSDAIKDLGENINKLNQRGIDKLNNLSTSVKIISVIDQNKLDEVLDILEQRKKELSNIIENQPRNIVDTTKQKIADIINPKSESEDNSILEQAQMNKKFDMILEKFDILLELMTKQNAASDVGLEDDEPTK